MTDISRLPAAAARTDLIFFFYLFVNTTERDRLDVSSAESRVSKITMMMIIIIIVNAVKGIVRHVGPGIRFENEVF